MKIRKFDKLFTLTQWNGQILDKTIGLDTETELIKSPSHIPQLVVTCAYDGSDKVYIITNDKVKDFLDHHKNHVFVLHNFAFDMSVLTKHTGFNWYPLIENNQIFDTALLFKLVNIATKGFTPPRWSLDYCVTMLLKDVLPKDNLIRLTFGQYLKDGKVDYKSMSKAHYKYAALDPVATLLVYNKLMDTIRCLPTSTNLAHQIHLMGDIALADIHRNGIRVDIPYTERLRNDLESVLRVEGDVLATFGWVRGQKGISETYSHICDFLGIKVPISEKTGAYSMKDDDLEPYKHMPFVKSLLKYLEYEKKHQFLNELTSERVHPRYDSLKNTARTSCKAPNMQNPPRTGGIRECFIPIDGCIFGDVDYSSIEMFTAAICMKEKGYGSTLFDVLNDGKDPHIFAASKIHGRPITKKDPERQQAKAANYGFLANMSSETFRTYALDYGLDLTSEAATEIKKGWSNAYPEVKEFWKSPYKSDGTFVSKSGFVRANCSYTAYLNTHFQGRAAEGIKIAMYLALKADLKMVAMIHDQLLIESPIDKADEELEILKKCMIDGMRMICNMEISVDGDLKERFSK